MRPPLLLAAVAAGLLACADSPSSPSAVTPGDATLSANSSGAARGRLTVMTQNMYVGADVDAIILALATPDPTDDQPALFTAVATLERTDFAARVSAIADEIARHRPHAIGLQEVSVIDLDLTGLGLPVDIHIDFLPALLQALAARELNYVVAAAQHNFTAAPMPGISLSDSDVLLVDADRVEVVAAGGHAFSANLGPVAPGVVLIRGYVMADVTVNDRPLTIVSAHPESGEHPAIAQLRALQAAELIAAIAGKPAVALMGDLNDVPGSPLYEVLTSGDLVDVWAAMRPGVAGYTAPHPYDLANKLPDFLRRIDYVFVRGLEGPSGKVQGSITLFGAHPSDRVDGALGTIWPSDHAGVIAEVLLPR